MRAALLVATVDNEGVWEAVEPSAASHLPQLTLLAAFFVAQRSLVVELADDETSENDRPAPGTVIFAHNPAISREIPSGVTNR